MKLIDKDRIAAEIERRLSLLENGTGDSEVMKRVEGVIKGYKSILSFLDTLKVKEVQEEPVSNDLEAEFVLYLKHKFNISQEGNTLKTDGWRPSPYDILAIAKHFAKWQKEQMTDKACEWLRKGGSGWYLTTEFGENEIDFVKLAEDFRKAMEE